MTTATLNKTKWEIISDADAVTALRGIADAKQTLLSAQANYEERLGYTPSIWVSKAADTTLSKESGVSKAQVGIYRRLGRILSMTPTESLAPSEVAKVVNSAFNAPGSLKVLDEVLNVYCTECDSPTWAGAVKAINASLKDKAVAKTDAEKFDDALAKAEALTKKSYVPTAEQKARLTALAK